MLFFTGKAPKVVFDQLSLNLDPYRLETLDKYLCNLQNQNKLMITSELLLNQR